MDVDKMKNIYVFDMDGTLIDSMGYFADGMVNILREDGIDYPEDIVNIITPLGTVKTIELFSQMGVKGTYEEIGQRMADNMLSLYSEVIKIKPFVKEYLNKLKAEGKKLYVLTASPHLTVDVCLKNNGVYDLFEDVWSTDDYVGMTKNSPEIYIVLAERVGCGVEDIVFFDDNILALENAKKAGVHTVGVYDEHYPVPKEEVKAMADEYIMSFEERL